MNEPIVVVKLGSSSVVTSEGQIDTDALSKLVTEVDSCRRSGWRVVVVASGAIAAGLPQLGLRADDVKADEVLRAASAVGQTSLMRAFEVALAERGLLGGQVLLAPTDFMLRRRYLKSRGTLHALLDLGVVPIVNENDAIADDEIRFGDNDRLAALVAHLVEANQLVLLTDTAGLFTADPRIDESASLIEEIIEIDQTLEEAAGGPRSARSRGGMASKLAAAKIATWSGVETVIAYAGRPMVLPDAILLKPGPLDPAEYAVMQQHPVIGDGICRELRMLADVTPIVRHHHERPNGTGYPDGLSGDQIPLLARILSVVDVYDALTSERPYRSPLPVADAIGVLRSEAAQGWLFDAIVEEFAAMAMDEGLLQVADGETLATARLFRQRNAWDQS